MIRIVASLLLIFLLTPPLAETGLAASDAGNCDTDNKSVCCEIARTALGIVAKMCCALSCNHDTSSGEQAPPDSSKIRTSFAQPIAVALFLLPVDQSELHHHGCLQHSHKRQAGVKPYLLNSVFRI